MKGMMEDEPFDRMKIFNLHSKQWKGITYFFMRIRYA